MSVGIPIAAPIPVADSAAPAAARPSAPSAPAAAPPAAPAPPLPLKAREAAAALRLPPGDEPPPDPGPLESESPDEPKLMEPPESEPPERDDRYRSRASLIEFGPHEPGCTPGPCVPPEPTGMTGANFISSNGDAAARNIAITAASNWTSFCRLASLPRKLIDPPSMLNENPSRKNSSGCAARIPTHTPTSLRPNCAGAGR